MTVSLPDDEEQERELYRIRWAELRRDIQIGIDEADRGEVSPLDIEAFKAEARARRATSCRV